MRCKNCGAQVNENTKYCPTCGAEIKKESEEKLCPNCHEPVRPGAKFCMKCGAEIKKESKENLCPNCHEPVRPGTKFCMKCGARLDAEENKTNTENNQNTESSRDNMPPIVNLYGKNENALPMKYYNFLVKFMLFFTSIINAFSGVMIFVQTFLTNFQEVAPQLVPLYIANGIFCIIIGGYALYVRSALVGFRKKGPMMLYLMYGAGLVFNLIYSIVAMILVRELFNLVMVVNTVQGIVVPIVVIILNKIYFTKRKHLFIN